MPKVWGVTWSEFCGKEKVSHKPRDVSYATREQGRDILAAHPKIKNQRKWNAARKELGGHLPHSKQMPDVWGKTWKQFKENQ
jgi:hypothetical protein